MEFLAVLFFGLFCMGLGFFTGFTVNEVRNLEKIRTIETNNLLSIIAQYEDDEIRFGLERAYDGSPDDN